MRCFSTLASPSVVSTSYAVPDRPRTCRAAPRAWNSEYRSSRKTGNIHLRSAQSGIVVAGAASSTIASAPPAITLTEAALKNLKRLRDEAGDKTLLLRMGVKSGGCSGMSYHMDFEKEENVRPEDSVMEYEDGFKLVCDPKSLLYLFGMRLDYSSALIGGGFQFHNPNAESSCGCGKSFGV
ncbi:Uncharacterized protein ycf83 [Coccomyxa sp. Obi]|nr:Uncharacterized protein ycf83 [Coccomyxa sp. Obi]